MPTILSIVNQAIVRVGESPVTAEEYDDDLTKTGKIASLRYASCKRQVLRSYHWKQAQRAIKIDADTITEAAADAKYGITLSGVSSYKGDTFTLIEKSTGIYYETPLFNYTRFYTPPSDLLRLKMVLDVNGRLEPYDFAAGKIEGDAATIYAVYTSDIGEDQMDETLADVVSCFLAVQMAPYLGATEEIPALKEEYFSSWRLAKSYDAQQDPSRRLHSVDWLEEMMIAGSTYSGTPYIQLT